MDLFQRQGRFWVRSFEEHQEYAYEPDELERYLHEAGFTDVTCFGDLRREPPGEREQRIYFLAVRENDNG